MDNDCLHLQNHKSEVPIATEQLARLPIIIIINHADFTVFSGTAGGCTGQDAAGAFGTARQAGMERVACRKKKGGDGGRQDHKEKEQTSNFAFLKVVYRIFLSCFILFQSVWGQFVISILIINLFFFFY